MKWIGQHIWDFISRFRSDVYLENISSGTIASGGNLGLDSNNKIVKATEATGDITGIDLNPGTGIDVTNVTNDDGGAYSADIAVDVSDFMTNGVNNSVVTATGTDAMNAEANLVFSVSAGEGTASTLQILSPSEDADHLTITTGANGATTITTNDNDGTNGSLSLNVDGTFAISSTSIDINSDGTISNAIWAGATIAADYMVTGTTSAQGAVEIATNAEAISGSDFVRAITPSGLKAHVDSRYSYAYMTWSASAVSSVDGSDPEWVFPKVSAGIYEEDWNKDENIKATSTGTTTYPVSRNSAVNALVIPQGGQCVGFHAHGRNNDTNASFKAGLFHLEGSTTGTTNNGGIDYGNTGATHEATLRWVATADNAEASGGADGTASTSFKGPCKLVSNTDALTVSAGDALLPAIMGPDASDEIFVTMTIILKIPLA